jgi:ubiquinone/menaquinone biosynthesis C-methylase UbiE
MTRLAFERARAFGIQLESTLIDLDLTALKIAREEVANPAARYVVADAGRLPFNSEFDLAIFANSLHLLDDDTKRSALLGVNQVLAPGAVLACNTTFYDGAYPEESKPFYSRWIRRSVAEMNRRLPSRNKGERAQAMESLTADTYRQLIECAGFEIVESRERRVLSASSRAGHLRLQELRHGRLHATDEDAEQAAQALQTTVQQTFRELKMKYLPRNWLEIIALKA